MCVYIHTYTLPIGFVVTTTENLVLHGVAKTTRMPSPHGFPPQKRPSRSS